MNSFFPTSLQAYKPTSLRSVFSGLQALILLTLLPFLSNAQNSGKDKFQLPAIPRQYHTQKNYQRLLRLDPEMARRRGMFEVSMKNLALNGLDKEVTIPVVVHVLYKTGTTAEVPKDSEVKNQLNELEKQFRKAVKSNSHRADVAEDTKFADRDALDTKIKFCLASKDPTGRNTSGILTVPTAVSKWLPDDKMKSATTGGSTAWDTEKYLNIWVVVMEDSIGGYAQMPLGPPATDGIVINARYFGKKNTFDKDFPYREGKTLTHLIGSYLNLYELWSESVSCGDDYVEDTPIHSAPSVGCFDYRFVTPCDNFKVAMTMNLMDNTNDGCQYMFTNGQKKRMQACLVNGGARYKLVQSGETQCGSNNLNLAQTRSDTSQKPPSSMPFTYSIYPNPASDVLNFELGSEKPIDAELVVYNVQGGVQTIRTITVSEGNQVFTIPCGAWTKGVYIVKMTLADRVVSEKILIH